MRRYFTLLVAPFALSAFLAAQPPPGTKPPDVGQPQPPKPTTPGPGQKPEDPAKAPAEPPKAPPAAEAPNPKAKAPVPKEVTPAPNTAPPQKPLDTPAPPDNPNPVKPGDCPKGQICKGMETPPSTVPANPNQYAQKFALSADTWFVGRVTLAATTVIGEVLTEPEATPDHEVRMRFVGHIMRNPDESGRRLARLVVISAPISTNSQGQVVTSMTDQQMITYLRTRWTALAKSMGQLF